MVYNCIFECLVSLSLTDSLIYYELWKLYDLIFLCANVRAYTHMYMLRHLCLFTLYGWLHYTLLSQLT